MINLSLSRGRQNRVLALAFLVLFALPTWKVIGQNPDSQPEQQAKTCLNARDECLAMEGSLVAGGKACFFEPLADGAPCQGGQGTCQLGRCVRCKGEVCPQALLAKGRSLKTENKS